MLEGRPPSCARRSWCIASVMRFRNFSGRSVKAVLKAAQLECCVQVVVNSWTSSTASSRSASSAALRARWLVAGCAEGMLRSAQETACWLGAGREGAPALRRASVEARGLVASFVMAVVFHLTAGRIRLAAAHVSAS